MGTSNIKAVRETVTRVCFPESAQTSSLISENEVKAEKHSRQVGQGMETRRQSLLTSEKEFITERG